jgi:lipopolysaccharide export system permease protein
MGAIERYIFRQIGIAFLAVLIVLTCVIQVTQVLRDIDLVTTKGQTFLLFIYVVILNTPTLVMIIAPLALFGACLRVLHKLNSDYELVVISAAGMSPARQFRPAAAMAGLIGAVVLALSLYVSPHSFRELGEVLTRVQANMIAVIVKPGQFTPLTKDLTFHMRDRGPNNTLLGVVVADKRDPRFDVTYLAERASVSEIPQGTFLILETGNAQRRNTATGETTMIVFDRYAFNLSQFAHPAETSYRPNERYTSELLNPNVSDPQYSAAPGRFTQELHDRLATPLYPLALVCVAYAMMGQAHSARQSRFLVISLAVATMLVVRGAGFAVSAMVGNETAPPAAAYAVPLLAILIFGAGALGYVQTDPVYWIGWLKNRLAIRAEVAPT